MLTINPNLSTTNENYAFRGNWQGISWQDKDSQSYDGFDYNEEKSFWNEQKQVFDTLTNENNLPKPVRKTMKIFSVLISGVLGAMAMGWASRRSIDAVRKFNKMDKVKNFKSNNMEKIKKLVEKFEKSNFGKQLKTSTFGKKATEIYSNAVKSYKNLKSKINPEKAEKYAVRTFGLSGGVTSGYAAMDQDKNGEQ